MTTSDESPTVTWEGAGQPEAYERLRQAMSPWSRHPQPEPTDDERQARYDLYEDVIVALRFDGTLTKAAQHACCQRIWEAARAATLGLHLPCGSRPSS